MIRIQGDHVVSYLDVQRAPSGRPLGLECLASGVERLGEAVAGRIDSDSRPESLEDLFAVQRVSRTYCQKFRQLFCAASLPGEVGYGANAALGSESSEQTDAQRECGAALIEHCARPAELLVSRPTVRAHEPVSGTHDGSAADAF